MKARQDYLPREKLDKYLNTNPSSSLSSLVPRGMTEDELTAEFTRKFESVGVCVIFLLRYVSIEKEKTGTIYSETFITGIPCSVGGLYCIETSIGKFSNFLSNLYLSDTAMKQTLANDPLVSELFMQVSLYLCKCWDQNNDERREHYDHYNH